MSQEAARIAELGGELCAVELRDLDSAFTEVITELNAMNIHPDTIQELGHMAPRTQALSEAMTSGASDSQSARAYRQGFRGSGAIVTMDSSGTIMAARYSTDRDGNDAVAQHYGETYVGMSVRKVFMGAWLARRGAYDRPAYVNGWQYALMDTTMHHTLAPDTPRESWTPHHLGYGNARRGTNRRVDLFTAVGVSGALPHPDFHAKLAEQPRMQAIIRTDEARGWVDWPHDQFAGYYDLNAARLTLRALHGAPQSGPQLLSSGRLQQEIIDRHGLGHNLH